MEFAVKRFARNILLLHLVLLLVVLGLLLLASKAIRDGAREQAQRQAETRQRMLASQTARGIEAFYQSIVSDMGLVPREDETEAEKAQLGSLLREMTREISFPLFTPPPPPPATRPTGGPATRGSQRPPPSQQYKQRTARGLLVGQMLGRQLDERVTHLFVVARPPEMPAAASKSSSATKPPPKPPQLLLRDVVIEPKEHQGPTPTMLIDRYRDWLLAVKEHSISRFELFDAPSGSRQGLNLVAMPIGTGSAVLVAAVPVSTITGQFLSAINEDPSTGVMLVNDSLVVMASSRPAMVGVSLADGADADLTASLNSFKSDGFKSSQLIEHPLMIAGQQFEPALLTAEPIDVAGRKWFIVVGSPLREVDAIVAQLFGRIFIWAVIVVLVITAILISTSVQMIRGRLRLEKVRNEALRKELDRARQIQQAWLPRAAPACRGVDVAAVNFPANHISGDFYNWFELPDGRIAVAIGDVTGHGMSAAFLMATTQLLVRSTMQRGITDPADCLAEVNRQLCTLVFNGQFVTLLVLVIDPEQGSVEAASAGHPAPLVADDGVYRTLPVESGLVLGVDPDIVYETRALDLPENAAVLLYTDGAPDVLAPNGKRLGTDGLLALCPEQADTDSSRRRKPLDARGALDALVASVNHFRGSRELGDDLTLVAIRLADAKTPAAAPELAGVG